MSQTDNNNKIRIAVAGHTNSGKTTIIRTFMKSPVGEIADRQNVTQEKEEHFYEGLQATFVDCPGFQNAASFSILSKIKHLLNKESESQILNELNIIYD